VLSLTNDSEDSALTPVDRCCNSSAPPAFNRSVSSSSSHTQGVLETWLETHDDFVATTTSTPNFTLNKDNITTATTATSSDTSSVATDTDDNASAVVAASCLDCHDNGKGVYDSNKGTISSAHLLSSENYSQPSVPYTQNRDAGEGGDAGVVADDSLLSFCQLRNEHCDISENAMSSSPDGDDNGVVQNVFCTDPSVVSGYKEFPTLSQPMGAVVCLQRDVTEGTSESLDIQECIDKEQIRHEARACSSHVLSLVSSSQHSQSSQSHQISVDSKPVQIGNEVAATFPPVPPVGLNDLLTPPLSPTIPGSSSGERTSCADSYACSASLSGDAANCADQGQNLEEIASSPRQPCLVSANGDFFSASENGDKNTEIPFRSLSLTSTQFSSQEFIVPCATGSPPDLGNDPLKEATVVSSSIHNSPVELLDVQLNVASDENEDDSLSLEIL